MKIVADSVIENYPTAILMEVIERVVGPGLLNIRSLENRINREKHLIEMRKDPGHEPWMEQR